MASIAIDSRSEHVAGLDTLRCFAIFLVIGRHAWEILKWPSLKPFFGNFGWIGNCSVLSTLSSVFGGLASALSKSPYSAGC